MSDDLPPELPSTTPPTQPPQEPLEFAPRQPPSTMNKVLKGCLIAIGIFVAIVLLLVAACFGLLSMH